MGDPSTRARALVAGNVQASTFSVATWLPIRQEPALRVLVDPSAPFTAPRTVIAKTNVATPEAIQNKHEELARFTRAVVAASRHLARHEGAWVDAVLGHPRPRPRRASEAWQQFTEGWG